MKTTWILPVACIVAGCGGKDCVEGTVTFNGQPVAKGYITFHPAADPGPTVGTDIVDGRFEIVGLAPGTKKVQVTSTPHVIVVNENTPKAKLVVKKDAAQIPADAKGNLQTVTIPRGRYTLDLALSDKAR